MDNPHIFDELTNRLNKVKRPDSGIHNSGEFIGDNNERMEKSDEQADSGQESDPAEQPTDSSGVASKRGGILKNFKKMFKIKRKSKTGKISGHGGGGGVISTQYRAVSEPEIIIASAKKPFTNDFTSDDDERLDDKRSGSLKDAPSFIRSSLRKLKFRRSKERKPDGGMDYPSTEVSPASVHLERDQAPPKPISPSPAKSPKKLHSVSPSSDTKETKSSPFYDGGNVKSSEMFSSDIIQSKPAVNMKESVQSHEPIIQSTAAKDKIRVAPRGRKKPTRNRLYTSPSPVVNKKSSSHRSSVEDISEPRHASFSKRDVKETEPKANNKDSEILKIEETFDSFINSLETVSIPDTSTPKKSSSFKKPSPKLDKSRENIEKVSNSPKNVTRDSGLETRRSVEKFQIGYIPLKDVENDRPLSVSLADVIKSSAHVPPVRRTKSFKTTISERNENEYLPNIIVPLKDESTTESRRYGKFRKQRSQTNPDDVKSVLSKSMEDVSRLNKENSRRSGNFNESKSPRPSSNAPRRSSGSNTNLKQSDENIRRSVERLKKSTSRQSLNEKTFALTSSKLNEDPVIPYGDSLNNELGKPRKLKMGSKDETKKPRPQSVTVRSCDATDIISQISPARSHGDIRAPTDTEKYISVKKDKQLGQSGRNMSVDTEPKVKVSSNGDGNVLEFRRMSLKKTVKTDDYLAKETSDDILATDVIHDEKIEKHRDETVEIREAKNVHPEFHRISLRKVEKRDDYLEKEPDVTSSVAQSEPESNDSLEKNKPLAKVKAFPFQSHDVKDSEDTNVQNNSEKQKVVPLSQTGKVPYFRRSVDIQENPNTSGVPAWIAMARDRERQREEMAEKTAVDDAVVREDNNDSPSNDVKVENLVKPSALKSKPTLLPKPATSPPKTDTTLSTSPTGKKPPPITQRPRFNAKNDVPNKDTCIVCGKTAYVLERCEVNKNTLHKSCAKCYICARTLSLGSIFINDGKVWCKQHR